MAKTTKPARRKAPAAIRRRRGLAIDVHAHINIPELAEFAFRSASQNQKGPRRSFTNTPAQIARRRKAGIPALTDPKKRLADMDKLGVDIEVISVNLIEAAYWASPATGARLARIANDNIAAFCATRPDRFVGMGSLPLQDPKRAIAEMERGIKELDMRGFVAGTNIRLRDLGEPEFHPFWARAEQLGVPIFIHPMGFNETERVDKYFSFNTLGQPFEEALAMTSLIYGGVMEKYPKLKVCIAHGGGYLPYYSGRSDHIHRTQPYIAENVSHPPTYYMKKFYFDSVIFDRDQLAYLISKMGDRRILLGSDFPYIGPDPVGFVRGARALSQETRDRIHWKNAAKLFRIPV